MKKAQAGFEIIAVFVLLIVIGGLIAGGIYVDRRQKYNTDNEYFAKLISEVASYYDGQAKNLGIAASGEDLSKTCVWQDEAWISPKSRLTCFIQAMKRVTIVPEVDQMDKLLTNFEGELKNQGFSVYGKIFDKTLALERGFSLSASKLNCKVNLQYTPSTSYSDAKTAMTYDLNCGRDSSHVPIGYTEAPYP